MFEFPGTQDAKLSKAAIIPVPQPERVEQAVVTHWTIWQCQKAAVVGPRGCLSAPQSDGEQLPSSSLSSMGPNHYQGCQLDES